jgi:hypothetical protein
MKSAVVLTWNKYSASAKVLTNTLKSFSEASQVLKMSFERWKELTAGEKAHFQQHFVILNWGAAISTGDIHIQHRAPLNFNSKTLSNKLKFFNWTTSVSLSGNTPAFTDNWGIATNWLGGGHTVVARQNLNLSGGEGIVLVRPGEEIPQCPLYTKYIKKNSEYRVHFVKKGEEFYTFWQKKKFVEGDVADPANKFQIRNHKNGWLFSSINFETPQYVLKTAEKFIKKIPLEYGALDIIYNEQSESAYVLEVNTAPGLSEKTVEFYANALKDYYL